MSHVRRPAEGYPPIGDYALLGDCHTAALVARDGSVDWYCPDRFDAPAALCRLLDRRQGGYLRLAPTEGFDARRTYRGPTNVLQTTFTTGTGTVRLTDCLAVTERDASAVERRGRDVTSIRRLLRLVEGLCGEVDLDLAFKPTFDFARARADLEVLPGQGVVARGPGGPLVLACPAVADLQCDAVGVVRGRLRLQAGARAWVVLTDPASDDRPEDALRGHDFAADLAATQAYWERWAAHCTYTGPYRAQVLRSALALKALTYEPTGAIVAAPTTSLPEEIGGERNWDYRYTWLRDASLILYALMTIGYRDEAADFMGWLVDACGPPDGPPRILYGIGGEADVPERVLAHLDGYRGSRPVRIGNAAATQVQLDVYGEVLNAAYLHFRGRGERPSEATWRLLRHFVDLAADEWGTAGQGIWEIRGAPRQFLYGKLLAWVALDRGLKLAHAYGLDAPLNRWRDVRHQIRTAIEQRGYNAEVGAFTQAFDGDALDASTLVIPRVGFLPATDPRVRSTIQRVRERLTHRELVYRYRTEDGLAGGEGTFTLCTFWLVDALALGGAVDEAHQLFEHVLGFANDVGLLSEEVDPTADAPLLGNFPQGFSHLALIGAAVNLAKVASHGAEAQAEDEGERAERAGQSATELGRAPDERGRHPATRWRPD